MDIHRKCQSCFKPDGMLYTYRGTESYYCRECFQDCMEGDMAITQLATYLAPIFKAWLDFHQSELLGETRAHQASSIELAVPGGARGPGHGTAFEPVTVAEPGQVPGFFLSPN